MKKVSIVVPVYKTEKLLPRCLDSLVSQSFEDIEIIVINDGSPDGSQEIIDDYVRRYPDKIRSIIKENGGISSVRNRGVEEVNTPYMMFADSDDYVEKDYVKRSLEVLERDDSDLVVFGYIQDNIETDTHEQIHLRIKDGIYSPLETKELIAYTPNAPWNKLYKTSLLKESGIVYPEGLVYEDLATTPSIIASAKKVSYIDEPLYRYRYGNPGHIMGSVKNDIVRIGEVLVSWFKERGLFEEYYDELYCLIWTNTIDILRQAMTSDDKQKVYDLIEKAFRFKEKNFPKPIEKYSLVSGKKDSIYLNKTLCKMYYKVKHL